MRRFSDADNVDAAQAAMRGLVQPGAPEAAEPLQLGGGRKTYMGRATKRPAPKDRLTATLSASDQSN
jgi:dihydropteroate synthase